jgi:4-hydroxy-tetrahydrodipicolinate synthase
MLTERQLFGIYVPVITPFFRNGDVDYKSFGSHIKALAEAGIHGLVINGTTGESPTVSMDEVKYCTEIAKKVTESSSPGLPIVIGTGTNDTASSIKRTELAGNIGADAALIVVPYYSRPSQEGIIEHYRQIAAIGVPLIVYDVPSRTGVGLTIQTVRTILDIDGVIGMKDSSGGIQLISELARFDSKPILCGEDVFFYAMLCCGVKGGMLASANIETEKYIQMYNSFINGEINQAKTAFDQLLPLIRLLFAESNPAPLKWLLARQGIISSNALRLPMTSISQLLQQRIEEHMSEVN